jgi:sulfide dehydrogenase [flavocytochrome c] flavoprotein chain
MQSLDRRQFAFGLAAGLTASAGLGAPAIANGAARVIVIGGGAGGATVAGHLKRAAPKLQVTLIEENSIYSTCFFSNHYIGGYRDVGTILQSYDGLWRLGVNVMHTKALGVDTGTKKIKLQGGRTLAYDRLVVAPGIDFKYDNIDGYSEQAAYHMPHAWRGGEQTRLLRNKLAAMEDGGLVLLAPPRNPFRCPPGPYERACIVADYLKRNKPKSKLVIVDPKMSFSKQLLFEDAFAKHYKDVVELHLTNDIDDMSVAKVDAKGGEVTVAAGTTFKAAVANIIPDQKAGAIAFAAGLTEGDWCPVDPNNFKSAKATDVYVIGDATIADPMPKSAFSANNHAKVVIADLLADLTGKERFRPRYRNTCWSMLAPGDSVKIGANYAPGEKDGKPALVASGDFLSARNETAEVRRKTYEESLAWYDAITENIFAKSS